MTEGGGCKTGGDGMTGWGRQRGNWEKRGRGQGLEVRRQLRDFVAHSQGHHSRLVASLLRDGRKQEKKVKNASYFWSNKSAKRPEPPRNSDQARN